MTNQMVKSLRDFVAHTASMSWRWRTAATPPLVPLTVRVAAAGHLRIENETEIRTLVGQVLQSLEAYARARNPRHWLSLFGSAPQGDARLRLVSQLAAGFDQAAADVALDRSHALHAVLPGTHDAFARDIESYRDDRAENTNETDESPFARLLTKAERVLELDADADRAFELSDYAQAGLVMLEHCDIVLIGAHSEAHDQLGGTLWLMDKALHAGLPVVRLTIDRPDRSCLCWRDAGGDKTLPLIVPDGTIDPELFAACLDPALFGQIPCKPRSMQGWFERRYAGQLDLAMNRAYWATRWELADADPRLVLVRAHVDLDLAEAKIWADNQASAFAEMLRGSAIISALLGMTAIFGAATGILYPGSSLAGKIIEIACISVIVWLAWRSRRFAWRSQWLTLRQLDRFLDQAAWLRLSGRATIDRSSASWFGRDELGAWAETYCRAVLRASSFPTVRLTPAYLASGHQLVTDLLVDRQGQYLYKESETQENAGSALFRVMATLAMVTVTAALIYLAMRGVAAIAEACPAFGHWLEGNGLHIEHAAHVFGPIAAWLGVLLPAIIAALAAIRSFGEYEQLAVRYATIAHALGALPGRNLRLKRSSELARFTREATTLLLQEVASWRSVFQYKELEGV